VGVNGIDKYSSLLRHCNNYDRKKFYSTGPSSDKEKSFIILKKWLSLQLSEIVAKPTRPKKMGGGEGFCSTTLRAKRVEV
jgi:hypothetical protein